MAVCIAFYVHHHGSGHLMRTLQIIQALEDHSIILMGSGLRNLPALPDRVSVVHLPLDTPENEEDILARKSTSMGFHYSPLGLKGVRERVGIMTEIFRRHYPLILVVDVSVEVCLLARLAGIATIVIRQHGKRDDLPHQLAYQSAELLIAPFPEWMYIGKKDDAYDKTFFTGGFSRFDKKVLNVPIKPGSICVLIGQGGTSLNLEALIYIAECCPLIRFNVIGLTPEESSWPINLIFQGRIEDPSDLMSSAEIIIGNTGHNTVMEVAAMRKRFIGIPETRPFDEQISKGKSIQNLSGIRIISPEKLLSLDWSALISEVNAQEVNWQETINADALTGISKAILETAKKTFTSG